MGAVALQSGAAHKEREKEERRGSEYAREASSGMLLHFLQSPVFPASLSPPRRRKGRAAALTVGAAEQGRQGRGAARGRAAKRSGGEGRANHNGQVRATGKGGASRDGDKTGMWFCAQGAFFSASPHTFWRPLPLSRHATRLPSSPSSLCACILGMMASRYARAGTAERHRGGRGGKRAGGRGRGGRRKKKRKAGATPRRGRIFLFEGPVSGAAAGGASGGRWAAGARMIRVTALRVHRAM